MSDPENLIKDLQPVIDLVKRLNTVRNEFLKLVEDGRLPGRVMPSWTERTYDRIIGVSQIKISDGTKKLVLHISNSEGSSIHNYKLEISDTNKPIEDVLKSSVRSRLEEYLKDQIKEVDILINRNLLIQEKLDTFFK